ncbi:lipoprotein N-acyltransferase Lnb domain-containing protein [Gaetbulibacter aestuarii]|uniref:DUF4105 domain-containing protein n=1 Tax=Gaetbulibacter aestuarii TaxID=1502358 RepID=A0ABW7MZ61_9FLAO
MRNSLFFLLILLTLQVGTAQEITLSNQAQISVLTIAPGASLNDAFGHNAFRIKDPSNFLDITYDFGRYDFDAPNFYLNFARGKLNYSIGKDNYNTFLSYYIYTNRTVREQVLNLKQSEKQSLYNDLVINYKPENREYLYDFFYNNCATKIEDVVNKTFKNQVQYHDPKDFEPETFRELIHDKVKLNSWGSLGIDIALGSVIDVQATPVQHMFLPSNIYNFFAAATIPGNQPLVTESHVIFQEKPVKEPNMFFTSPLFIFGVIGLLIIYITYRDSKRGKRSKWLDFILFLFTGIIGIGILLLWFATDHSATQQNYNLLWAFALNILMIDVVLRENIKRWFLGYVKFLIIMLCLLTLHWLIGVQVFAIGLIPLLIALFVRYVFLSRYLKKQLPTT